MNLVHPLSNMHLHIPSVSIHAIILISLFLNLRKCWVQFYFSLPNLFTFNFTQLSTTQLQRLTLQQYCCTYNHHFPSIFSFLIYSVDAGGYWPRTPPGAQLFSLPMIGHTMTLILLLRLQGRNNSHNGWGAQFQAIRWWIVNWWKLGDWKWKFRHIR